MPRFVLLRHDTPAAYERGGHWDLMLEHDLELLTWSLGEEPQPGVSMPAEQLANHRLAYLEYEGPVSGDRGSVRAVDRGDFEWEVQEGPRRYVARLYGSGGTLRVELTNDGLDPYWTARFERIDAS